ncbi:MAG: PepSY-associated TM helix domain-containing protein [Myxococcales bacterium]|nr:PepSY-associated TM helix domain-containing protein [Myxococcales bacterium]
MAKPTPRKKNRWRPWLRALHRDFGYLVVGLTFVYAMSGLAVNHLEDRDPNFVNFETTHTLAAPLPEDEQQAAAQVLAQLEIDEAPADVFLYEQELEIQLEDRSLYVDGNAMTILDRGRRDRPMLRLANWLHLNRGKKAWTVVADGYAVLLLFLAGSGMFMLPGKKGMRGRGWILVLAGAAIPVGYVLWSGGP